MRAKYLVSLADTVAASLLIVAAESVFVGLWFRGHFADGVELKLGTLHGTTIAFAMAAPIAVVGLGVREIASHAEKTWARRALTGAGFTALGALALQITNGRHFQSWAVRAPFVLLLAALAAALVYRFAPRLAAQLRGAPARVGAGAAGLLVATILANAFVLPRLYPPFHTALALLTVALASFVALLVRGDQREEKKLGPGRLAYVLLAGAAPLVAALFVVPWSVAALAPADNARFVMAEHAPTVGYAIRYAAAHLPTESEAGPTTPIAHDEAAAFSLEGRDIVLISVDALRADHVGAYGYARPTTPRLDALAAEGVRFEHAYTATPHTSYAVTSMMTGKYMRPLLLQTEGAANAGEHDTFAKLLRVYGYRTAAFYPPAVFFIDPERFGSFRESGLDFEYRRVEFLPATERAGQVATYLDRVKKDRRVFLWLHLFEPHEPYERHDDPVAAAFGDRDVDRYDGEIRAADEGIGRIVDEVRKRRPEAVFVITADHGEEFGEHGGRFHGTTVYEEQVRVPLIIVAKGLLAPRVVQAPVQTVDLLPTVLASLRVPRPARLRGNNIGALATGKPTEGSEDAKGFAFAETEDFTMVAQEELRLVCARRAAACQIYDLAKDPSQTREGAPGSSERREALRRRLRETEALHGRFEVAGLRAEGKAYPAALRRGIAGDGDAAIDVAALLEDSDLGFRRKAAEILFELARPETAAALRLSLMRDEDEQVRRWCALALTRLGEGAGKTLELVDDKDISWRRLASLALAEGGDARGGEVLASWFAAGGVPFERARQIIAALGKIRVKTAIAPLAKCLQDVRLRPLCVDALVAIGDSAGRPPLLDAYASERRIPLRESLGRGLLKLGAGAEMAPPTARFLGMPDPLPGGVGMAIKGKFLPSIGGPDEKEIGSLGKPGTRVLHILVPRGGNGKGARLVVRGRSRTDAPVLLRFGKIAPTAEMRGREGAPPELLPGTALDVTLPRGEAAVELVENTPASWGAVAGQTLALALTVPEHALLEGLAVVPLSDELPPPAKEPWTPTDKDRGDDIVDE